MRATVMALFVLGTIGCGKSTTSGLELAGAGATRPSSLYSKWIAEYRDVTTDVTIRYRPIGSGAGIQQITAGAVDFAASDAPMTDQELENAPSEILHFPSTVGAVVMAYNLPRSKESLRLTPDVIVRIYLGEIRSWSDPAIAEANPGVVLPTDAIAVVYRTDASSTTTVFTRYLSVVSAAWREKVGSARSVSFPVGRGAKGDDGVGAVVSQTSGSIGYLDLAYARQAQLQTAAIQNAAGAFVLASPNTLADAAAGFADRLPDDLRLSIVNAPGETAYPIASFTYLLVYRDLTDAKKATALVDFIRWVLRDGQRFAAQLEYGTLPEPVVTREEAEVRSLTANGQVVVPPE